MADHPILGLVLFGIGFFLVSLAYTASDTLPLLLVGHIFGFNGALWVTLWCRKQEIAARRTR
jgi:Na+/phosphate symporter